MKVDNPRFYEAGDVWCQDCPLFELANEFCLDNDADDTRNCPTAETYAEACGLAERAVTK